MVLVTGGTGFIGSRLVERMLARGLPVRCLVRDRRNLRHLAGLPVELAQGDLAAGTGLPPALAGVDTVFHLAGVTKALDVRDYYAGNRDATRNLAEASRLVKRFIHVSSLAAAGPSLDGQPFQETAQPHPVSHYGRSKLQAEMALHSTSLWPRTIIVRPPVVYGPRDTDVFAVFRLAAWGYAVQIGRSESYFSLIHVDDLVDGLLAAADSGVGGGATYYLANTDPVSWRAFAETAGRAMGRKIRHAGLPLWVAYGAGFASEVVARLRGKPSILSREKIREARYRHWVCDSSRARKDFGFSPRLSVEAGVKQTIGWYRASGWLR